MATIQEIVLRARGELPAENGDETRNKLLSIIQRAQGPRFLGTPPPDVGVMTALISGIKEGFLAPLTIFGREREELPLDETSEKVANLVGHFVGLGAGYVPFVGASGLLLRTLGVTRAVSAPVSQFMKHVLAGTTQASGMAESVEEIPEHAAYGFVAGAAVDGILLARAFRKRAGSKLAAPPPSPTPTPPHPMSVDEAIIELTKSHIETVRFPELADPTPIESLAKSKLPNAQVLSRQIVGGKSPVYEVLIHNPVAPDAKLSQMQINQWKQLGYFEDMPVMFRNDIVYATGKPVAPGFVQLRTRDGRAVFAARESDVSVPPTMGSILTERSRTYSKMAADLEVSQEVGFVVDVNGVLKRGVVDTSGFERVRSPEEFLEKNREAILQIKSPSLFESAVLYATAKGIKGLRVVDEAGFTRKLYVFDQSAVRSVKRSRTPATADVAKVVVSPKGDFALHELTVSWKNSVSEVLREFGHNQKTIAAFLDNYMSSKAKSLEDLLDAELKALAEANRFKFYGGCI